MAVVSGTTLTYGVATAGGLREDLSDTIFDLFPGDTYCLTNFDKESASSTYTEWLSQELATPGANIQVEGDDATYASLTAPRRHASYTQIAAKNFLVSDSLEKVNKAGRKSELARGAIVKMREMKRDMEYAIVQNQITTSGASTTGRSTAGIEAWIGGPTVSGDGSTTGNAVFATLAVTTGTTPPVTSGGPGTALTDPTTLGPLTATVLSQALMGAWAQGGDPSLIMVASTQKAKIDNFTGVATRYVNVDRTAQASITNAANVFVSDFGTHQVILSRYMRTSVVLCLDPSLWAVRYLRKPMKRQLAKTGDATKYQLITEFALVARNWKGNSKVVGCA